MEFVAIAALASLVFAFTNFLKYVTAGDWRSARTQLVVWAAGFGCAMLAAQTQWAAQIVIGDTPLSKMSTLDLLFVGPTIASLATLANEYKKARDNTDSAATPGLGDRDALKYAPVPGQAPMAFHAGAADPVVRGATAHRDDFLPVDDDEQAKALAAHARPKKAAAKRPARKRPITKTATRKR